VILVERRHLYRSLFGKGSSRQKIPDPRRCCVIEVRRINAETYHSYDPWPDVVRSRMVRVAADRRAASTSFWFHPEVGEFERFLRPEGGRCLGSISRKSLRFPVVMALRN
jgi:hypothetical protein